MPDMGTPEYDDAELHALATMRLELAGEIGEHEDYVKALFPYRPDIDIGTLQTFAERAFEVFVYVGGLEAAKRIAGRLADEATKQGSQAAVAKALAVIKDFWNGRKHPDTVIDPAASPADPNRVGGDMVRADRSLRALVDAVDSAVDSIITEGEKGLRDQLQKEGLPQEVSAKFAASVGELVRIRAGTPRHAGNEPS